MTAAQVIAVLDQTVDWYRTLEAHVRHPVHVGHAAEIDESVTQAPATVLSDAADEAQGASRR
jgi:hypothetical protein